MKATAELAGLVGTWRCATPWDSEDYRADYEITVEGNKPRVSARDLSDGEEFVISEVRWDGEVLSFRSLMPSTGREGLNEFRLCAAGKLNSRFTFTVAEELHRVVG